MSASRAGVTGQRVSMESRVEGLIQSLHGITDKAVAVGFGVSGPDQVHSPSLPSISILVSATVSSTHSDAHCL